MDSASVCDWKVAPQDTRSASLSVHLRRRSFVFPWHTFLFADGTDDEVRAVFHSHFVRIEGSGLSALVSHLAEQRVASLTEPDRTAKFRQSVGPLITAISVTEAE
jgi:hypothetical protein